MMANEPPILPPVMRNFLNLPVPLSNEAGMLRPAGTYSGEFFDATKYPCGDNPPNCKPHA